MQQRASLLARIQAKAPAVLQDAGTAGMPDHLGKGKLIDKILRTP